MSSFPHKGWSSVSYAEGDLKESIGAPFISIWSTYMLSGHVTQEIPEQNRLIDQIQWQSPGAFLLWKLDNNLSLSGWWNLKLQTWVCGLCLSLSSIKLVLLMKGYESHLPFFSIVPMQQSLIFQHTTVSYHRWYLTCHRKNSTDVNNITNDHLSISRSYCICWLTETHGWKACKGSLQSNICCEKAY